MYQIFFPIHFNKLYAWLEDPKVRFLFHVSYKRQKHSQDQALCIEMLFFSSIGPGRINGLQPV